MSTSKRGKHFKHYRPRYRLRRAEIYRHAREMADHGFPAEGHGASVSMIHELLQENGRLYHEVRRLEIWLEKIMSADPLYRSILVSYAAKALNGEHPDGNTKPRRTSWREFAREIDDDGAPGAWLRGERANG